MKILLCIYSWGFYNRLSWMLQSIKDMDFKLDVRISVCDRDPFLTEKFIGTHQWTRIIKYSNLDFFSKRSNCRNQDLMECSNYDYICFLDGDLVFDKGFFIELVKYIREENELINVPRDSFECDLNHLNSLVRSKPFPNFLSYFKKLFLVKRSSVCIGGGYFQMVNCNYCIKNNIQYSGNDRTVIDAKGQKTYSDQTFRKNFNKVNKIINMENRIYHLHHLKGNIKNTGIQ